MKSGEISLLKGQIRSYTQTMQISLQIFDPLHGPSWNLTSTPTDRNSTAILLPRLTEEIHSLLSTLRILKLVDHQLIKPDDITLQSASPPPEHGGCPSP